MTITTYHNFDLLLTRAGARYKAIVVDAPAGEESVLFDPADALPRLDSLARGVARDAERHIGAADDPDPTASPVRPTFTGSATTSWTLTPANHVVVFSPDQEAVTVSFSDFTVTVPAGATQARRTESLALPVRSGPRGYAATATVLGLVDCSNGGRATLTLQVGAATRTVTCQDANSGQVTVQGVQPANADLRIFITAQVWGVGAQPSVTVDMIDIGLAGR